MISINKFMKTNYTSKLLRVNLSKQNQAVRMPGVCLCPKAI